MCSPWASWSRKLRTPLRLSLASRTASSPSSTSTLLFPKSSRHGGKCKMIHIVYIDNHGKCAGHLWSVCFLFCLSSRCRFQVTDDTQSCTNQLCPGRDQLISTNTGFDLLVDFTDHTGTLHACTLRSPVAENTLGCTVSTTSLEDDCLSLCSNAVAYLQGLKSTRVGDAVRHLIMYNHEKFSTCCRRMSLPAWLMMSELQWSGNSFWRDAKYMWR